MKCSQSPHPLFLETGGGLARPHRNEGAATELGGGRHPPSRATVDTAARAALEQSSTHVATWVANWPTERSMNEVKCGRARKIDRGAARVLPFAHIFEKFRGNLPAANQKKMQGNVRNLPAYL